MSASNRPNVRRGGVGVASPCISVCVLDPATAICTGCFRTLDEIAAWSVMDDAGKRAVLAALPARRAQPRAGS
jgi:predicted Fe-S protein YdhL (DUF1289 family)